jgi:hypothetical protein
VEPLGVNAFGEVLDPGRVGDCYLGLLLPPRPAGEPEAGSVLVVAPRALLWPQVPQPAGSLVNHLLTGHPDRQPQELVFLVELAVELRAWPVESFARLGVDPGAVEQALIGCWQQGLVKGLQFDGISLEEAASLARPAMTVVREQLRAQVRRQVLHAWRRWSHPSSRSQRQPGESFL